MKRQNVRFAALLPLLLLLCHCGGGGGGGGGDEAPPALAQLQAVDAFPALQFQEPVFLTAATGDAARLFVVERRGVIRVFPNDPVVTTTNVFLDISDKVSSNHPDEGMLGLAFDPDYQSNHSFYVYYSPDTRGAASPRRTEIARFAVSDDPDAAERTTEHTLLSIDQPAGADKGGWLGFGPDGKLYIATGDGAAGDPGNNAQSLISLLGKILRIDKDGRIPTDNPFARASSPDGRGAIWAYGLRNPRASFDRQTGDLWAGDAGRPQGGREEVDVIVKGGNYGWRKFEGTQVFNADDPDPGNAIPPVFEYAHENGRCEIVGGYVYRGAALAGYQGVYLFADRCTGEVFALRGSQVEVVGDVPGRPTSFGEDAAGELYVTTQESSIYKLVGT